ncbi:GTP-binding protein [Winogradskyella sp. PC-19]|uniref:GTP-binding protein n=1 Tax=unclassified Winogradskyella TaxID=2615021 RepID=UPI000B3C9474|nr:MULTISPECIES: GTP-binding protein [unclassified Winogradskyella]ARV10337.1 GTP-binding protein [Winogradskyella sp. PC-19]RZN76913.1 MAG: GTP-binding protein [Winogradskyella sp.]
MELTNEIVLRPRFKFDVETTNEILLTGFEEQKSKQSNFIVTRLDDHVFIRFPKQAQHYWSPQLHLEINEKDKASATVHGLFGPNPTIWTMFMFFHFIVAGLFIAFGIWAYTNMSLGNSYAIQMFMTLFMIIIWFTLYFIGRMGKAKGKPEMYKLHAFMRDTLRDYR